MDVWIYMCKECNVICIQKIQNVSTTFRNVQVQHFILVSGLLKKKTIVFKYLQSSSFKR